MDSATDQLIEDILDRFHAAHRRELPELLALARKIEESHRHHPALPHGLTALLQTIAQELESHMQKEEQILFPMMRAGGHPMIEGPISVMLAEHESHGERLDELESLTRSFQPPQDASESWRALCSGARKFVSDVREHIRTENDILFPRFID